MVKLGREYIHVPALKTLMEDTGARGLELREHLAGAGALAMDPLTRAFNWSRDEDDLFLTDVQKDLRNSNYHAYFPV
ncbi:TAM domain methyltransferase [Colletotrichum higginsianum]|nr:TAM domain methyltransferase [Colletotrichum higginsianum]